MADLVATTVVIQAAYWSCEKIVENDDGTFEKVPPFQLMNVTIQSIEPGGRGKSKLVFWFERSQNTKRVELAKARGKLYVDVDKIFAKYQEFRNMTFNKSFAAKDEAPNVGDERTS